MLLSGMEKLKIVTTVLFIFYVVMMVTAVFAVTIEDDIYAKWVNSLSYDEYNDVLDLYEELDYSRTDNFYNIIFLCEITLGVGLFGLMVKSWGIKSIDDNKRDELTYRNFKQDIIGTRKEIIQCGRCNQDFSVDLNVGNVTKVKCPYCGTIGIVDD